MITRRLFVTGSVALVGAAIATIYIARYRYMSDDEKTVYLLKKAVKNKTDADMEELFSHLLVYPKVENIDKLKYYWNRQESKRISLNFKKHIRELDGIVPAMVFRLLLNSYECEINEKNIPSWDKFIEKHSDAIAVA